MDIIIVTIVVGVIFFVAGTELSGYKNGQTDALKGKYEYKMQVVYELNDTIPVDTLFVKIK
jgi:hypothetical protein